MQIYTQGRLTPPPGQLSIDALNTTTPNLADLMADLLTDVPLQLSIDALNTATPNLADLMTDLPLPSQLSIGAFYTTAPNLADLMTDILADLPPEIEHRCLEYHYTKHGRSTSRSTGRSTPHKSSMDDLNTTTYNLADLPRK